MHWHFNSTTKSPQHIYLRELIKSLSSHFPSRCSSSSPSRFNKQGHRNNCRGQRRAKGGHMFAKHKHHLNVCPHKWASGHNYEARYRHLVDSSDGCDGLSASLPLSLLFLRPFLAAPADRLRGDIVRRSWVTWGLIAKSPFSSYIKKLFIPGAQKALLIHAVLSGQSWHMWDEQLCGLASLTLFCCLLECRLKKKDCFHSFLSVQLSQSSVLKNFCIFGSSLKPCFINPLESWSKQLFSYSLCLTKPGEYSAEFLFVSCSALQDVAPNRDSVGWKQSTSTLLSFSRC